MAAGRSVVSDPPSPRIHARGRRAPAFRPGPKQLAFQTISLDDRKDTRPSSVGDRVANEIVPKVTGVRVTNGRGWCRDGHTFNALDFAVIYTRLERNGPGRAWISAVAGGSPVRLVKTSAERDWPGSWSPDGNWFVYLHLRDGKYSLNKVKTTGQAEPEVLTALRESTAVPVWSPAGDRIMYRSAEGSTLISPDGGTTRDFPNGLGAYAFSADGQTLWLIEGIDAVTLPK